MCIAYLNQQLKLISLVSIAKLESLDFSCALTLRCMGGAVFFCPLLKRSLANPYLKIKDISKLFCAYNTVGKKNKKI